MYSTVQPLGLVSLRMANYGVVKIYFHMPSLLGLKQYTHKSGNMWKHFRSEFIAPINIFCVIIIYVQYTPYTSCNNLFLQLTQTESVHDDTTIMR